MARRRREFTHTFKREAFALLESSGRPRLQIAAELGIQPSMLRQWRAAVNGDALRLRPGGEARALSRPRPIGLPRLPGSGRARPTVVTTSRSSRTS